MAVDAPAGLAGHRTVQVAGTATGEFEVGAPFWATQAKNKGADTGALS